MGPRPRIAQSARKHGVTDEAMLHAYDHFIDVFELDDGLTMRIGGDPAGALYEIGVSYQSIGPINVHSMPARPKYLR